MVLVPDAESMDLGPALEAYRRDGIARLGPVIDPAFLATLRDRADDLMLGRLRIEGLFFQHDSATGRYEDVPYGRGYEGPSNRYRKLEKLEKDDRFRALLENALFERIARALIGPSVSIYRAVMFNKAARDGSPLPWHQDAGRFWGLDRDPQLQIWTAIDDAPEDAGCLSAVLGSHARGLVTPLGGVVPKPAIDAWDPEAHAVAFPAQAGEVLLVHNFVWHKSGPNRSDHPRRGFSVCYMDGATRCLRTKHAPRSFVRVFEHGSAEPRGPR